MSTSTPITDGTSGNGSQISMKQIYNLIMQEICPDLTTDMLPRLDALYQFESPAEHNARQAKYTAAFALYEEKFASLMKQWQGDIEAANKALLSSGSHA